MTDQSECTVEDEKFINPCSSLKDATEYGNPSGKKKGIFWWQLTELKTGKKKRSFFGVKSGQYVEKGLIFNFCPFCGNQIDKPFSET